MEKLIQKFYQAFNELDAETMISCYHDDIVFQDPAFGELKGDKAKNMWRMLCSTQKKEIFDVEVSDIKLDGDKGSAHWEAKYVYRNGRAVHNKIDAKFEFKDGKIIDHRDHFNLHKWAQQALGFKGLLLGGTSFFKKKMNVQTNSFLDKFESTL